MDTKTILQTVLALALCLAACEAHGWWHGGGWGWGGGGSGDDGGCENKAYCTDGNQAELSCPEGYMIKVLWAAYLKIYRRYYCGDPNASDKVRDLCDTKNTCQFTCDDQLFNETTCNQKTEKLRVSYECVPDPCAMFCCANGGQCTLTSDMEPMCECTGSWNGTHCDDNPCDGLTCENNGTCLVNFSNGTAQCCCENGFTGPNCETAVANDCTVNPCQNEGNCTINAFGIPQCECPDGFGGTFCNVDCSQRLPCPVGFEELPAGSGKCYFICPTNSQSWLSAEATCISQGATLWEPNDIDEVNNVTAKLVGSERYWTGANDGLVEGTTVMVGSGQSFTLDFDGTNTMEKDCVEIDMETVGWLFKYRTCTVGTRRCICERLDPCQSTLVFPTFQVSP